MRKLRSRDRLAIESLLPREGLQKICLVNCTLPSFCNLHLPPSEYIREGIEWESAIRTRYLTRLTTSFPGPSETLWLLPVHSLFPK